MDETINDYWGKLKIREKEMQKHLKDGYITQDEYNSWYRAQIGRGENFDSLRDKMAQRAVDASSLSHDYIKNALLEMYAVNRNYAAYQIESITGADFTLLDEYTVKRLLAEKPDLMPHYPIMKAIDKGRNLAYSKTKITDVVTSGII